MPQPVLIDLTLGRVAKKRCLVGNSQGVTNVFQTVGVAIDPEPNDPIEPLKEKLNSALANLDRIKTSIHGLTVQIRDLRIETNVDQVQNHVDSIQAPYGQYTNTTD